MNQARLAAELHGPDAIDAMPRPFVAENEFLRIGGRELQMVQPVGGPVNDLLFAGRGVHGEHGHRNARLLALQQPHFLGLREGQRLAVLAGGRVVGVEARVARALLELIGAFRVHAQQQGFVGVDRADEAALDLARCAAACRPLPGR